MLSEILHTVVRTARGHPHPRPCPHPFRYDVAQTPTNWDAGTGARGAGGAAEADTRAGAGAQPLRVRVEALREIGPDEELFFSYIDVEMGVEERQDALRDYGFVCKCPKCERGE